MKTVSICDERCILILRVILFFLLVEASLWAGLPDMRWRPMNETVIPNIPQAAPLFSVHEPITAAAISVPSAISSDHTHAWVKPPSLAANAIQVYSHASDTPSTHDRYTIAVIPFRHQTRGPSVQHVHRIVFDGQPNGTLLGTIPIPKNTDVIALTVYGLDHLETPQPGGLRIRWLADCEDTRWLRVGLVGAWFILLGGSLFSVISPAPAAPQRVFIALVTVTMLLLLAPADMVHELQHELRMLFGSFAPPGDSTLPWHTLAHAVLFAGLGGTLALARAELPQLRMIAELSAFGVATELLQTHAPGRSTSIEDMLIDALAATIGIAAVFVLLKHQNNKSRPQNCRQT